MTPVEYYSVCMRVVFFPSLGAALRKTSGMMCGMCLSYLYSFFFCYVWSPSLLLVFGFVRPYILWSLFSRWALYVEVASWIKHMHKEQLIRLPTKSIFTYRVFYVCVHESSTGGALWIYYELILSENKLQGIFIILVLLVNHHCPLWISFLWYDFILWIPNVLRVTYSRNDLSCVQNPSAAWETEPNHQ